MDKDPGYAGKLPHVFPYRAKLDPETAWRWIEALHLVGRVGFAVTQHRFTEESVTLWLSHGSADYLCDWGGSLVVSHLIESEVIVRRPLTRGR
jgi:hypothetical protein